MVGGEGLLSDFVVCLCLLNDFYLSGEFCLGDWFKVVC